MPVIPEMEREEIDRESLKITPEGIIEVKITDGIPKKAYISTAVDISKFYKDFKEQLEINWENFEFKDVHGKKSLQKKGYFLEHDPPISEYKNPAGHLTRPQGIFEHHYVWAIHNGFEEHETRWHARTAAKFTSKGWYQFKLQIDVRNLVAREILDGNKKKKVYFGTWELRNELRYKTTVIPKMLHKIPIVKNSKLLQQLYLDYIYYKHMEADVRYARDKILPMIYEPINKHFQPGKSNDH